MRALLVSVALCAALAAPASSQQPNAVGSKSGGQTTENKHASEPSVPKSATTHFAPGYRIDRSTYDAICYAPKDKDHADLCQQWRVAESAGDQVIINIIGLVLLFGTFAFTGVMAHYSRAAADATTVAAGAAVLSARATIGIQLPIIRATPSSLGHGLSAKDGTERQYCSVHFVDYFNLGPTKAFPIEIQCGWTVGNALPSKARYQEIIYVDDPHFILEPVPAEPMRAFVRFNIPLEPGEWPLICEGKLKVWFYCVFVYEDFMRTRHHAGFCWCWKYVGTGNAWRIDDTPTYNSHT